ncbi:MAG: ATP-binding protein [Firmicutes bacterium]|uniref:ATP-binding protein n=1 Tax=Candidatus Alloenteromonas pullistercoris TaxID=2840785 RepID=A0A9D9DEH4_9FIRM|nr:ATP-binding protein [Candidatus Enteromonas pullistercoris]
MDMSFDISSNLLVAGETGTGKTYFLKALIKKITQNSDSEANIYIDDPKEFEYRRLLNGTNIRPYDEDEATSLMESRLLAIKENKEAEFPPVYVIFEEFSHRLNWLKEADEKDEDNDIGDRLLSLCDRTSCKKANVHLVCTSQVPHLLLSSTQVRAIFDFLAICYYGNQNPFEQGYFSKPWQENLKTAIEAIGEEDYGEWHLIVYRLKGRE